jgi:uncharacterized protein (TIGR02996 family)
MAVHLVYRCYYNAPGERHVRRFECDRVVDWVRSIWKPISDDDRAAGHAKELLGGLHVPPLARLFPAIAEEGLPPPETVGEVVSGLGAHVFVEEEEHGPHHLQMLIDYDDNQVALYLFDDHFRALYPGLTDFLLLEGWELPGTWSDTGLSCLLATPHCVLPGDGEGSVYTLSLFTDCKYNLDDLSGGSRIEGARVPDLCRYVLTHPDEKQLDYELRWIRRTLQEMLATSDGEDAGFLDAIRNEPGERLHWNVYSDWLAERGLPPAGLFLLETALRAATFPGARESRDPALDRVKVTPHMAQACKHEERAACSAPPRSRDSYTQWIYFDDRWIAANPTLATGVLRFAARWDVLTTPVQDADLG